MMRATVWLPMAALATLVALTFWLERQVRMEGQRASTPAKNEPDVIINNFNATKMAPDGSLRYLLRAEKMTHYPAGDTSRLDRVSFESRSPDRPPIKVTSNTGMVTDGGDMVVMEGNVVMNAEASESAAAWTMSTEKLTVLPKENIAKSDVGVRLIGRDLDMTADTAIFNTKTREADLTRVRATYISKKSATKQ